jgi:integrase
MLTDTQVRKAKPGPKPARMYDERGLYLEVTPSGGRWWRFKYRFGGKEKLLSMGTYPDVSLAKARERRDEARRQMADGVDPGAMRKEQKEADRKKVLSTFQKVAEAWLAHQAYGWKAGTHEAVKASLETHVFPKLGDRPVVDIQPRDVREVVQAVDSAGTGETAGRVFQRIRAIYRFAIQHDLAAIDPTYPLKPAEILKPRKVKHRAALAERDMPEFLRKLDAYDGEPTTRLALELLTLTAVRPGELRGARWEEIDEERALFRIPAERMKMETEHLVPLSKQALDVLVKARELSGTKAGLVFPSPFYPGKPLSDGTLNSALARMGYKGIATAHGFRTLFSTCANEAGWNGDLIEKQLAHEERDDVRGAYNRAQYLAERTKLMTWWADRLDTLRKGADVLPFKAADARHHQRENRAGR